MDTIFSCHKGAGVTTANEKGEKGKVKEKTRQIWSPIPQKEAGESERRRTKIRTEKQIKGGAQTRHVIDNFAEWTKKELGKMTSYHHQVKTCHGLLTLAAFRGWLFIVVRDTTPPRRNHNLVSSSSQKSKIGRVQGRAI